MSLKRMRMLNPGYSIHTIQEPLFNKYGRVLAYDTEELRNEILKTYKFPETGSAYIPELEQFASCHTVNTIRNDIYGELPIQTGLVHGRNQSLTGIEYHQGSEVNIAIRDCILVLAKKEDMVNDTLDGGKTVLFYLKKGDCIEIYSDTLHYTPIQTDSNGFSMIVILLRGTNTLLDGQPQGLLIKKNKWYITHTTQTAKIEAGCLPNLLGELITLQHN